MSEPAVVLRSEAGIAWLELDVPGEPVNKIDRAVREELDAMLDRVAADPEIRAAILTSRKPDTFSAGADIGEFRTLRSRDEAYALARSGQALVNRFGQLGKPVVAAIHGACLGGGLEVALACAYRIATDHPKTQLGLPEVRLGIIPAAGGCQRLPRLIGMRAGLDLILQARSLSARHALRLGVVDEVVHPAALEDVARAAAERLAGGWKPERRRVLLGDLLLDGNPLGHRLVFARARQQVQRRAGPHYPAPAAALRAVAHGLRRGVEAGLELDAELFADLAVGEVSRNLVRIFFASAALKRDWGIDGAVPSPRTIVNLGMVGAGFMGAGIAGVAVSHAGVDVRFRDVELASVGRGLRAARRILADEHARRRITWQELRRAQRLLSGSTDWSGFRRTDLVIEAVFEDLDVKHEVLRQIEAHVHDECLIASNTSTIPIARLAEAVKRPERLLGMHFFSPVGKMPLLEVIVTSRTAPWATVTAVDFGRRVGKTVIVVRDDPGFWVNRILAPYLNEAGRLLEEGVTVEVIDREMVKFGFPVGPVTVLDEVGLDVAHKASQVLQAAFGDRMQATGCLTRMIEDGRLGRKNGRGFFLYEAGQKREGDQSAYEIIGAQPDSNVPRDDVEARLVFAMLNEVARALDEGVVRSASDGDIGAVFGIGYPAYRGGPLRHLDAIGAGPAVATLERLAQRYGERFNPCPRLLRMAAEGGHFYSTP